MIQWSSVKRPKKFCSLSNSWDRSFSFSPDENECLQENGGCQQQCVNQMGSFSCECGELFILGDDRRSCIGKWTWLGLAIQANTTRTENINERVKYIAMRIYPRQRLTVNHNHILFAAKCPAGFSKAGDLPACYHIQSDIGKNFRASDIHCSRLHPQAHLATVDTQEKRLHLATRLRYLGKWTCLLLSDAERTISVRFFCFFSSVDSSPTRTLVTLAKILCSSILSYLSFQNFMKTLRAGGSVLSTFQ